MPDENNETGMMQEFIDLTSSEVNAPGQTAAQKTDVARRIYITWRNTCLRGMASAAFAQVESESAALIAAIAAAL